LPLLAIPLKTFWNVLVQNRKYSGEIAIRKKVVTVKNTLMKKEFSIEINSIPYWTFVAVFCISIITIVLLNIGEDMPKIQGSVLLVRKIKFLLYTDKDFSSHADCISFAAGTKNSNNNVIRKSPAISGKLSGTLHYAVKLIIEKIAPDKDAYLKLGFPQYAKIARDNRSPGSVNTYQILKKMDGDIQLREHGCYHSSKQ
jgi:hypothetical protein